MPETSLGPDVANFFDKYIAYYLIARYLPVAVAQQQVT